MRGSEPPRAGHSTGPEAPGYDMDQSALQQAESALGYTFRDRTHLNLALTHASVVDSRVNSNERMEFLGDAVLGLVVCARIYERYPRLLEGEMTKIKSLAVSRQVCSEIAATLGLASFLILGKGMQSSSDMPASLPASALEAVIAAIYLDGGIEAASGFLIPLIDPHIDRAAESGHQQNFKSVLQQHAQRLNEGTPIYRVLDEKGPDHAKCFKVGVELAGRKFTATWAQSKKRAEQMAALAALRDLGILQETPGGEHRFVERDDEISRQSV